MNKLSNIRYKNKKNSYKIASFSFVGLIAPLDLLDNLL